MTRAFLIFGALYGLFFATGFPMLLYYNINDRFDVNGLPGKNPWLAMGIVALSVILWCIVLAGYFRKWVLSTFTAKRNIERLKEHGVRRSAEILSAERISKNGAAFNSYQLSLSFNNLAGTPIIQKAAVNDGKPHEHRFVPGKKIDILIDRDMRSIPYFIFASTEATIHKSIVAAIVLGWCALVALIGWYYVFSYEFESFGMGWRFMSFVHPLFICPVVLLFYRLIGKLILRVGANPKDAAFIKFKGLSTTARLVNASQTGMYINEQPMVRFDLEFTDERHQQHKVSLKKVVDLLHLDVARQETAEIFYLKENPQRVAFASDLDDVQ
ncbi:hypothetical protein EGT74_04400 [Chitinophaga lutea]|uniref:Uncharacterized protein n=1 Tax=Chitinophaga lutea TaxID=2488634 RepID=A0A3N4Q5J4_9BACT|nr:hypothetical protein [Chitinophaga lutea]RPE12791.1 hypothetical protein EGT74_04400 [Chitinophaga lutea]